jgi:hypothetical protein
LRQTIFQRPDALVVLADGRRGVERPGLPRSQPRSHRADEGEPGDPHEARYFTSRDARYIPKQSPCSPGHGPRHTTGSLLMMAGANPAAVQRILRHSDPRITTEVYGHLAPGYLRAEIDRLHFRPPEPAAEPHVERAVAATLAHGGPFGTGAGPKAQAASKPPTAPLAALVLQGRGRGASGASLEIRNTEESSASISAGWTGLET